MTGPGCPAEGKTGPGSGKNDRAKNKNARWTRVHRRRTVTMNFRRRNCAYPTANAGAESPKMQLRGGEGAFRNFAGCGHASYEAKNAKRLTRQFYCEKAPNGDIQL